jgi:hypothetical protein
MPQERGLPEQLGAGVAAASPLLDAKTESFFCNFFEPQCEHLVPFQSLERTSTSLSRRQSLQWNS